MGSTQPGLVEITREFLHAYRLTREVVDSHRAGTLDFEAVKQWVGDDEASSLFRLKERCHALFRPDDPAAGIGMPREALFDLAVGSLFHETMKFRENFYQLKVYGPKVQALRAELGAEADVLFREFEKILAGSWIRIDEALQETEVLLEQTREQFRLLLIAHNEDGFTTRYLIENEIEVAAVFDAGLDNLLADIHGDTAAGYARAADSYLRSGHFQEAHRTLSVAISRDGDRAGAWTRLAVYAEGMTAYLDGHYLQAVDRLNQWVSLEPTADESLYAEWAIDAISRVGELVASDEREAVSRDAESLVARLSACGACAS